MSSSESNRRTSLRIGVSFALAAIVASLLFVQLIEGRKSATRTVGIAFEEEEPGLVLTSVTPGAPAAEAGLREGDAIVAINDRRIESVDDYDLAARDFDASRAQRFEIERDGEVMVVAVAPGMAFEWQPWSINTLAVAVHLALGLLVLVQAGRDVRSRLLAVLFLAIAIELSMPFYLVGAPLIYTVVECAYWLLTGLQFAVELHLAAVIPQPQRWFASRRWPLILFYGLGAGLGVVMAAASLPGAEETLLLGWTWTPAGMQITSLWFVVWPLGVVLILGNGALRWPEATGRHQAMLVLLGTLPWALLTLAITYWDQLGVAYPAWVEPAQPLVFLIYPTAVLFAIFRYHLFDLELVVRRSLVYAALSTALLLLFYAALGAGGAVLSALIGGAAPSALVLAAATLLLGLLFSPLKQWIEKQIEHRFFPERRALRERLASMVRDLPGRGQLSAMAATLVEEVVEIFAVEGACLMLSDRDSDLLVGRASKSCGEHAEGLLLPKSDGFVELLRRRGRSCHAERWPASSSTASALREMGGELAVPIMRSGEVTGLLLLSGKEDADDFRAEEIELLDLLSHHVATVLENAHLYESATIDSLTGLLRRESVIGELRREVERALRYRRPLTVAMVDIDRFKSINDEFGHLAGDLMLRRVAGEISDRLRNTDIMGRYGGEEFLLLLPESDLGAARAVVEKLRLAVERLRVEVGGDHAVGVTISIGLAALDDLPDEAPPTPEALLAAADRSLYQAKNAGRNRVAMGVTRWAMQ